jgi:tetratricopeptide (TPR) repeat protein
VDVAGAHLETPGSTDPEVQRLKEQARDALRAGDFARAEELLNQAKARDLSAIERMEADLDGRKLSAAEAAAENGALMMTQIRYTDAARYYAEAVGLTPEKYAEQLSGRLTDWAVAAQDAGDYRTGLDAARRALALNEARLPTDDARLGSRLNNLALLYRATGRYGEAEPLYRRAVAVLEKSLPSNHPHLMIGLESYAGLLDRLGRGGEAGELRARAEAIRQQRERPPAPPPS